MTQGTEDPSRSRVARLLVKLGAACLVIGVLSIVAMDLGPWGSKTELFFFGVLMALIGAGLEALAIVVALARGLAIRGAKVDTMAGLLGAAVLGLLLWGLWVLEGAAGALSVSPR